MTFTSTSVLTNSATTTYYWMFGSGIPTQTLTGSSGMYTSQTFTAPGTYTVQLWITSTSPTCSSISTTTIVIPTSTTTCFLNTNFTYSQGANGLVNFNNTSTGTVSGTTYTWFFGDGGTSTATSPAHTYSANGTYVAKLIANNNFTATCIDSTITNVVVNSYCTLNAGFTFSYLSNGMVALFNTTTPTTTATYTWNFINNSPASSNLANPLITYSANGTYTINLVAMTSAPSCTSNASAVVTITNATGCNLVANFSTIQGTNGAVTFTNTSTGTNTNTTYSWNFGNSQSSTLASPSITYATNGYYTVTLTATTNGTPTCTSTKTLNIFVNSYCNLNASFVYTTSSTGVVTFSNTSTGASSTTPVTWSFGHSSSGNPGTSTISAPSHYYPNGTYTVSLTIFSSSTCVSTATQIITVNTITCSLNAAFTHTVGSSGLVNFSNTSTGTGSYFTAWNFGDGWTSNSTNPSHTYSNGGTHYVRLVITDTLNASCADTIIQAVNITGIPCVANANFTLVPSGTPQFWLAIPSYPYNMTAAQWSWGDGSTSNSLYTSHQYSAAANYTICLTVTVSCGASASTCSTYYVSKSSDQSAGSGIINVNVQAPDAEVETGLFDLQNEAISFQLFPNPNKGEFKLVMNENITNETIITVNNLIGEVIYQNSFENSGLNSLEISLPNASSGIYFVHIKTQNKTSTQKVIIHK